MATLKSSNKNQFSKNLEKSIKNIQTNIVNKSIWETTQELKEVVRSALSEIVETYFYNAIPESDYYDRQGLLLNSIEVNVTQGGGYYRLYVWFDLKQLTGRGVSVSEGKLIPYTYSYGKKEGQSLSFNQKQALVDYYDETYGFNEKLLDWFNREFSDRFEKDLKLKIKKYGRASYKTVK